MDVVLTVTKRPSSLLPPLTADMVINGTSMNSAINQMTAYINTVKFANPVFGGRIRLLFIAMSSTCTKISTVPCM